MNTKKHIRTKKVKQGTGYDNGNEQRKHEATSDQASTEKKWSQARKKKINCANPKGFSQRAYCAGKRKRVK